MERIDTTHKLADAFGPGKDGFQEGSPGLTGATELSAAWFDAVQEELANLLEVYGSTALIAGTRNQLSSLFLAERKQRYAREDIAQAANEQYKIQALGAVVHTHIASGGSAAAPQHVVVGAGGKWSVSVDRGRNWAAAATAGSSTFQAVCYAGSVFAAVGSSQVIYESDSGVTTWTLRSPAGGFTGTFYDAIYFNSLTIICGTSTGSAGVIQTGTSGTYTSRTVPAGTSDLRQFATDGTTLVCVGAAGANGRILASTDGTTWITKATPAGITDTLISVCWCPGLGLWAACTARDVYTSPDLVTWTGWGLVLETNHALCGVLALEQGIAAFHYHTSLTSIGGQCKYYNGTSWHALPGFGDKGGNTRPTKVYPYAPVSGFDVDGGKTYALWISNTFGTNYSQTPWRCPKGGF